MSHHYSGPDFGFAHGDARLDLTDLYAFPSPERENKTIFVMNVHPSVGRPAAQNGIKALMARGFHKPGDVENRLGYYLGEIPR